MMEWLPEAQRVTIPSARQGKPNADIRRVIFAATEVAADVAFTLYDKNKVAPHLTVEPATGTVYQHLPFSVVATGTKSPTPVTLTEPGTVIVALVGRTADSANWPEAWLRNVAIAIRPVVEAFDIPPVSLEFLGSDRGDLSSSQAPQRVPRAVWDSFTGFCGIQHLPDTNRCDPGRLDIDTLISCLRPKVGPLPAFSRELKKNSKSKAVAQWQEALGVEVTSRFDQPTIDATKELQSALGVEPTGLVDEATWNAARDLNPPTDALGPYPGSVLSHGSIGGFVARWQTHLGLNPSGVFDSETREATSHHQRTLGLQATGKVDEATWTKTRFQAIQ
jgi:hypothetical protein